MSASSCRLVRFAFLLAFVALPLLAGRAHAAVPSPPNCVLEPLIIASWDGSPAPAGNAPCGPIIPGYDVVVRDVLNIPIAGSLVVLQFTAATGRPHLVQNGDITVLCPTLGLAKRTDASGLVRFSSPRVAGYSLAPSVGVFADGVFLGSVPVISPDYNADGALTISDFAQFSADYLSPVPQPRSDFNNCLPQLLPDYSYFSAQYIKAVGMPPAVLCP